MQNTLNIFWMALLFLWQVVAGSKYFLAIYFKLEPLVWNTEEDYGM